MKGKNEDVPKGPCETCAYSYKTKGSWVWSKDRILCIFTGKEMNNEFKHIEIECSMFMPRKGCMTCNRRIGEPKILADGNVYICCAKRGGSSVKLVDSCEDYLPGSEAKQ